jgi:hypothetical protein
VKLKYLNPEKKKDTQLPESILFDSPEAEKIKRLLGLISNWSTNFFPESDWRLQCRTGKRPCEFTSILEILNELESCRHLAPRRSDVCFFKLLETIDSPNPEYPLTQFAYRTDQPNPRLEQRNRDLRALCNATEVIDGFAILAAGGEDDSNPKAPVTLDYKPTLSPLEEDNRQKRRIAPTPESARRPQPSDEAGR